MPFNATTLSVKNDTVNEAVTRMRPHEDAHVVVPADASDIAPFATRLWIGGAGNIKVNTLAGSTVTIVGIPAGTLLPLTVTRVFSTGTTATSIVALHD